MRSVYAYRSIFQFNWLCEPGTKLCKPESFAHFLVHIRLRNKNKSKALEDLVWLENNWRPDIVSTEVNETKLDEDMELIDEENNFEEIEDPDLNIFNSSQRSLVRVTV